MRRREAVNVNNAVIGLVIGALVANTVASLWTYFRSIGNKLDKDYYERDQEKLKEWFGAEVDELKAQIRRADTDTTQQVARLEAKVDAGFKALSEQILDLWKTGK